MNDLLCAKWVLGCKASLVLSIIIKTYFNLHREEISSIDSKGHLTAM